LQEVGFSFSYRAGVVACHDAMTQAPKYDRYMTQVFVPGALLGWDYRSTVQQIMTNSN